MFDKSIFKLLCIFSAIIGGIIAIPSLIPPLTIWGLILLAFGVAPFIIVYFKRLEIVGELDNQKAIILGSISGAAAGTGFCVIYIPLATIINLIFKSQAHIWAKEVFINFFALIFIILLIAMVIAMFNAFSGFLTAYFYSIFNKK